MKNIFQLLIIAFMVFALMSCESLIEMNIERRLNRQKVSMLKDDKLHVVLIGSGGPMNNSVRLPTSTAVIAGGEFILVDVGPGTMRNADLLDLPLAHLTCVLLTHFHSDHMGDMGEANFQSWAAGRKQRLEIFGPKGVEEIVQGFIQAYEPDIRYRITHHGEKIMAPEASRPVTRTISILPAGSAELFFDRNGLKIYAFTVDHFPAEPAFGYRFEYKGNVVVFTGDTKKIPTLAAYAKNADLLVSEALSFKIAGMAQKVLSENNRVREAKIMQDIRDYHMSPVQAAEIARDAAVKKLVFHHVVPPVTNFIAKRMFMEKVHDVFDGDILLGEDGMVFDLEPKK